MIETIQVIRHFSGILRQGDFRNTEEPVNDTSP